MKDLKDWTSSIAGLADMGVDDTLALYSEMLATSHDIGYKVPDSLLIETEDAEKLKKVIPPLHEGLITFHAAAKAEAKDKSAKQAAKPAKPIKKTSAVKAASPKKPAKPATQKDSPSENTEMTTATAKKTAKKAPAKKAAKAGAGKKAPAKKAAANARTPVARNPFGEKAVIKVLVKENPARADSQRGKRIAVVFKYNGKKVSEFYEKEKAPFNRTDTLRYLIDNEYITIK